MKPFFSRKEQIIISAIEIIDEMGFNDLSVRELANRQNISEAALYRHFKNKEEIVLAVLDYYCRFDAYIINTVKNEAMSPHDGIRYFILSLVEAYQNQPALITIVTAFETLTRDTPEVRKTKEIFNFRREFIASMVLQGQQDGTFNPKLDRDNVTDTIMGIFRFIALKWRVNGYEFSLKERMLQAVDSFLGLIGEVPEVKQGQ